VLVAAFSYNLLFLPRSHQEQVDCVFHQEGSGFNMKVQVETLRCSRGAEFTTVKANILRP
jgi:hypothetical protein